MSELEYEAEKIVNYKYDNGIMHYEVKWAGYGNDETTWEPYFHLENCQHLIDDFFNSLGIARPPDHEPRFGSYAQGFRKDPMNPNHIIIDKTRNYYYPYLFVKEPKNAVIPNNSFFSFAEVTDHESKSESKPIEIRKIARKSGKLFVVVNQNDTQTYIAYETAVMLFPDALHNFLKNHFN